MMMTSHSQNMNTKVYTIFILIGLEAGRKKNNTEKDLDSMLFGGAPVRRREKPAENKPVESKPSENKVIENKSIDKNISGNK